LQSESRERDERKRLLSDGSSLWWEAVLFAWFLPLVCHGFGVFLEKEDERKRNDGSVNEWICKAPKGYFYQQWRCIGSDDWPVRIDENTKRRCFFFGWPKVFSTKQCP
jgi:hypothetical protein